MASFFHDSSDKWIPMKRNLKWFVFVSLPVDCLLWPQVFVEKAKGEILGVVIVESGWGSILPTVIIANMMHAGPAERSGRLNIGDQIMSINGTSLVGLPLSTCQSIIKVRMVCAPIGGGSFPALQSHLASCSALCAPFSLSISTLPPLMCNSMRYNNPSPTWACSPPTAC